MELLYAAVMAKMNQRTTSLKKEDSQNDESEIKAVKPSTKKKFVEIDENSYEFAIDAANIEQAPYDENLSDFDIDNLRNMLKNIDRGNHKASEIEIEASFGLFDDNRFYPGLKSSLDFSDLKNTLLTDTHFKFRVVETNDVVEIMENPEKKLGNIRMIYNVSSPKNKTFQIKVRDTTKNVCNINNYGVRVTSSLELENAVPENVKNNWKPHLTRRRKRCTFTTKTGSFSSFKIDVSFIEELDWKYEKGEAFQEGNTRYKYEVEIEAPLNVTAETFAEVIKYVYMASISNGNVINETESEYGISTFFSAQDRQKVVKMHNILFRNEIKNKNWRPRTKTNLYDKNFWNKPKNIKIDNLMPKVISEEKTTFYLASSYPTVKLNGRRMFLFITNQIAWLVLPPYKVARFAMVIYPDFEGSYLDGEYVEKTKTYHVFDILFYKGVNVMQKWFLERRSLIKDTIESVSPYYATIKIKMFYTEGKIYQRLRNCVEEYRSLLEVDPEAADGIIIQPANEYFNNSTYKVKPADQLTIDFKLTKATLLNAQSGKFPNLTKENYKFAYILSTAENKIFNPYKIRNNSGKQVSFEGIVIFNDAITAKLYEKYNGQIVECRWNHISKMFDPIRAREDRFYPNNADTANDIWYDIHNPIAMETITGEDLVIMRKIHNKVKEDTLKRYLKSNEIILDIGSGRGGDLTKWRKLGLNKVYAVEPNEENSKELVRRLAEDQSKFKEDMPDIDLLSFGAENTEKIKERTEKASFSSIVSFFSLTYFGETRNIYKGLIDTISLIPSGGYFIGAVMDGKEVGKLLNDVRISQSRNLEQIEQEINDLKSQSDILAKNPLKNNDKIAENSRQIEKLTEESYKYMPHEQLRVILGTLETRIKSYTTEINSIKKETSALSVLLREDPNRMLSTEKLVQNINIPKNITTAEERRSYLASNSKPGYEKTLSYRRKSAKNIEKIQNLESMVSKTEEAIKKFKDLLRKPEYHAVAEDEPVEADFKSFKIEQVSEFDMDDYVANEIEITITDPTSMVKNQTEWLFNFDFFASEMQALGFLLVENRLLNGKDIRFLSHESRKFSSLNRLFCFKKQGEPFRFPIEINSISQIPDSEKTKKLVIKAVPEKYGSIIHAVLTAVDTKYNDMSLIEKENYVLEFRKKIAARITRDKFQDLHGGELAKRLSYQQRNKTKNTDEAMDVAFTQFKLRLVDSVAEVSEVSLLELLSETLKIAIYILTINDRGETSIHYYSSDKVFCEKIANHKLAVILAKREEFYLIGEQTKEDSYGYIFTKNSKIITSMRNDICK